MRKSFLVLTCMGLIGVSSLTASAQTPAASPAPALAGIKANLAVGEVAAINQADNKLSINTSDGAIDVTLGATTEYKRVSAANPNLQQAAASSLAEVAVGDKLLVVGKVAADKKTVPAKTVYIMSKADIAKRDTAERDAWRTRGVSGRVTAIDPNTKQITVAARGGAMAGAATNVVITPKETAKYYRYASDSARFADAKASTLSEIKIGDEVRALGDKSEDGTQLKAEQVISGAFKTVVGNITAIDAAKNEITVKETQTGKTAVIVLNNNSVLKRFPAETAAMMAGGMAQGGMRPAGAGQGGNVTMRPPQQPNGGQGGQGRPDGASAGRPGGMGQGGGGGMRGGRDLDSLIERFPTVALTDLKVGDAIGVSSTAGAAADRYTAIKLIAGVEPFITMQTAGGGRGRNGQSVSIDIPGLDGGFGEP